MAELPGEVAACQEEAEGHADVGCKEHIPVELGYNDGDGEEDGVARLVRGEAVVIGEGYRIFVWDRGGLVVATYDVMVCGVGKSYPSGPGVCGIDSCRGARRQGSPCRPVQKVKSSNSISAKADGLTGASRWLFDLEINVCGVDDDGRGEAVSFEAEETGRAGTLFSWPCSVVAESEGVISRSE